MPGFYAHHRFGKEVLICLREDLREVAEKYRVQFDIGLQGPDLFFFYKPYRKNRVVTYGHQLHKRSVLPFFEHGLSVVERRGVDSREYAYLLGFICHFMLDSQCHSYVNSMVLETGVEHLEIEEEFEKFLLQEDGKKPVAFSAAELVPRDGETAASIAPFYDGISEKIVADSLADLQKVKRLLTAPGILKQGVINGAMKISGHYGQLKGLMNQRKDNPACEETNRQLRELFEEAVPLTAAMIESYDKSLRTGERLAKRFDRNFE